MIYFTARKPKTPMPPPRRFPPLWIIDEHPELLGHPDEPEE
jgi:hypothetical protein